MTIGTKAAQAAVQAAVAVAEQVVQQAPKLRRAPSQIVQVVKQTEQYSTSNQILPRHVEAIAKAGFRTILALRPDGEGSNQPSVNALAIEARKHKVKLLYVPITNDAEAPSPLGDFKIALARSEAPILAFCRSGQRAARLFHQAFPWKDNVSSATVVGKLVNNYQQEHDQWL